jgi:methionine-rich copper-binding protein CopC
MSRRGVVWLTTGALLLAPASGWSHAALVRSSPARRAILTQSPEQAQLWFNEPVEPRFSTVSVWDAEGARVDLENAAVAPDDPKRLSVGLRPLRPGRYTIRFRVLSVDGHVVEGEIRFEIRATRSGSP